MNRKLRLLPKLILFKIATFSVRLRWKLFGSYYNGLLIQAEYLYRQSPLFKDRWNHFGLEFAESAFRENSSEIMLFFNRARRGPLLIRGKIFLDGLMGWERRPYYLPKD